MCHQMLTYNPNFNEELYQTLFENLDIQYRLYPPHKTSYNVVNVVIRGHKLILTDQNKHFFRKMIV